MAGKKKLIKNGSDLLNAAIYRVFTKDPLSSKALQDLLDVLPDDTPILISEDWMRMSYVPLNHIDWPVVPPMEIFLMWIEALKILRAHEGVRQFMIELGQHQPRVLDLGLVKPYLPSRYSESEYELALYREFPQHRALFDFVLSLPVETFLGLQVLENENDESSPMRTDFALDEERTKLLVANGFDYIYIDGQALPDFPYARVDLGDYLV